MINLYHYYNTLKGGYRLYALGHDLGSTQECWNAKADMFQLEHIQEQVKNMTFMQIWDCIWEIDI